MRRLMYFPILAAAFAGVFFRTYVYPGIRRIDFFGMSDEYLAYLAHEASFATGLMSTIFALIVAQLLGVGAIAALSSSLIAFLAFYVADMIKHDALFTLYSIEVLGSALPGFFAGSFCVIGIWHVIVRLLVLKHRA